MEKKRTEAMFRILSCVVNRFSSRVVTQLDTRYTSRDLLNRRGMSIRTRRDDHRISRLLLDDIAAVLQNGHSRNRTSCDLLRPNNGSRVVSPRNHATTLWHVHGWVR